MKRRGYTLVEIMVAVVILSIAVLGLIGAQIHALRSVEYNRQGHVSSEIAHAVMSDVEERVRQNPTVSVAQERIPVPQGDGYSYEVSEAWQDPPINRLRRVEVRIYFMERGTERTFTLWTLLYNDR